MATWDKTITRNAKLAFERKQLEKAKELLNYETTDLASDMAKSLLGDDVPTEPKARSRKVEGIKKTLEHYMGLREPKTTWKIDYLEALSYALSVPIERLMAFNYDQAKVPEADWTVLFARQLAEALPLQHRKRLIANLKRGERQPEVFEMINRLLEAIFSSTDQNAAAVSAAKIIASSASWTQDEVKQRRRRPKVGEGA